jgi:hypothetical protein
MSLFSSPASAVDLQKSFGSSIPQAIEEPVLEAAYVEVIKAEAWGEDAGSAFIQSATRG